MNTVEDELTMNLVEFWTANRPEDLPAGWNIYHHLSTDDRDLPCVVVGHEGAQRVTGCPDTRRVNLRVMSLVNMDEVDADAQRTVAGVMEEALDTLELKPGPLEGVYLHGMLYEAPQPGVDREKRQGYHVLRRLAMASLYR